MSGAISWLAPPSRTEACFRGGSVLFQVTRRSRVLRTACTGVYPGVRGCIRVCTRVLPLLPVLNGQNRPFTSFTPLLTPFYAVSTLFDTARTLFYTARTVLFPARTVLPHVYFIFMFYV